MPIRLTLLFFIILFAKTNSSAPTTIIKTDINGYMSFLLSNSDLLLNFVFKLYHKTCEQFYRNFGLYEKSPNSFLPGLSRSIINQFRFHNLLCLCLASVHLPHPFHLVFSFQLLCHAVLLCQLWHNQLHAVSCRFVNLSAILSYVHPAMSGGLLYTGGFPWRMNRPYFSNTFATSSSKSRMFRCWGQMSSHWPHLRQSEAFAAFLVWTSW